MIIYTTDSSLAGEKELIFRIYHSNSILRDYLFNVTFLANTAPTFNESVVDQVINWGFLNQYTLPLGVDAEGDSIWYTITPPNTLPFTFQFNFWADTVVNFTGITWSTTGAYEFNYRINGGEDNGGLFSEANFTATINNVPTVTIIPLIL